MKRSVKAHSQHFLRSPRLVASLFGLTSIKKDEHVLDLGAGSGVITSVLAANVRRVTAVELEPRALAVLRRNVSIDPHRDTIDVVEGDVLQIQLPDTSYSIFSNIPFHISAPIVRRFFNNPRSPRVAALIVQRQFGQKLVSSDTVHFTSQLGMMIGAEYAVKVLKKLNKNDFTPPPAVDTVLVELKKRPTPLIPKNELDDYRQFTERCFSEQTFLAKQPLHIIGATPGLSPSRLSISQWVMLFNARTKKGRSTRPSSK